MNEDVMVVETAAARAVLQRPPFDLIRDDAGAMLRPHRGEHFFVARADAEVQPKWRQIIPYVVVMHGDDVFTLRRLRKQTEARLHDKVSIGIGGHINPGHDVLAGLHKELDEEIAVDDPYDARIRRHPERRVDGSQPRPPRRGLCACARRART